MGLALPPRTLAIRLAHGVSDDGTICTRAVRGDGCWEDYGRDRLADTARTRTGHVE